MAAKEIATTVVSFETKESINSLTGMNALFDIIDEFNTVKKSTFVCPYKECGKPWPMMILGTGRRERPLTEEEYAGHGPDQYCCDATRQDCEGA